MMYGPVSFYEFGIPYAETQGYTNHVPWEHGCDACEAAMANPNVTTSVGATTVEQNQISDQAQQRAVVIGVLAVLAAAAVIYTNR